MMNKKWMKKKVLILQYTRTNICWTAFHYLKLSLLFFFFWPFFQRKFCILKCGSLFKIDDYSSSVVAGNLRLWFWLRQIRKVLPVKTSTLELHPQIRVCISRITSFLFYLRNVYSKMHWRRKQKKPRNLSRVLHTSVKQFTDRTRTAAKCTKMKNDRANKGVGKGP